METVISDISFNNSDVIKKHLIDIIDEECSGFKIDYEYNFKKTIVKKLIDLKDVEFDQISLTFKTKGEILLQKFKNSLPRIYFNEFELTQIENILIKIRNNLSNQIVYSSTCEELEKGLQNSDKKKNWSLFEREIPSYAQIIKNPLYKEGYPGMDMIDREFISIESLPGHQHLMNYNDMLWFGSSWQMYFSTLYYKYIPKPLFDDFKDCYENIIFENGLRKITLHKNVMDYDLPENRQRQWSFRQQLGIDSIAHELTRSSNRIEPLNLPVIITKQNCEKGQTRVTRFLDDDDKLVSSNRAVKKEIKEYLNDGITIVFEKTETN